MPLVDISLLTGRSEEQLRRLSRRIYRALIEEIHVKPETVQIIYREVDRELWHNSDMIEEGEAAQ